MELENLHAVLAEAQTRAAALEQIVDYGREAAQKETEALVNRGTALLARAEEAAAGTNTWQEHLAAGKRQHEELTARYAAAKTPRPRPAGLIFRPTVPPPAARAGRWTP